MSPAAAKRLRLLASVLSLLVLVVLAAAGWFYFQMRASLPQLDGPAAVTGLGAKVTITRDALGVPTIKGQNRTDIARALGWLHAQDRFFQMDLLRRRSAGELAELFGKAALPLDRTARMHGFRALSQKILADGPPAQRALLEAYAAGVNAGLNALHAKPFEYLVLRTDPSPWRAEDCLLVNFSMWLDLQDETGRYEHTLMTLRDQFGPESLAFFAPLLTPNDAALDGTTGPAVAPVGPNVIDLRKRKLTMVERVAPNALSRGSLDTTRWGQRVPPTVEIFPSIPRDSAADIGSNAFALSGAHTANGAGLLANDMHLGLAVPNIWYRASIEYPGHKITGTTLPGTPIVTTGSNGHVAWGFTVAYADTGDLIAIETVPGSYSLYRAPGHELPLEIEQRKDTIRVKDGEPVDVKYPWTIWGPIVGTNDTHHPLAYHWLGHEPAAVNLGLLDLEDAADVTAAVDIAHRAGIPALNFVAADSAGKVAWTIAGLLPKRVGYDGRLPTNWGFGDRRWDGFLKPEEIPTIISPGTGDLAQSLITEGRVWSANHREVGGAALAVLGDGGYARPPRAAQIRDTLKSLEHAQPSGLFAIQLDERALFLAPWQKLLVNTLTPAVVAKKSSRAELRALAAKWEGHASIDSVSYRLVRSFRSAVMNRIFAPIFAPCVEADEGFDWGRLNLEPAVWTLLHDKPAHLLNPDFSSWDEVLAAAADDVVTTLDKQGVSLAHATWGARNTARIIHPFSRFLPAWLGRFLNMPADPLAGDTDMPRVVGPTHGASERFVVSPGHEAEGLFHMPGGQSGHPLSPYYRTGHAAWVHGEPAPFLPGPSVHTLELSP